LVDFSYNFVEEKLDNAMRNHHELENAIEGYEVKLRQTEENNKNTIKKYQELQKKHKHIEKELHDAQDQLSV